MGEEAIPVENGQKNETNEKVEEKPLALVPVIENKEKVSPTKLPPPAPEMLIDQNLGFLSETVNSGIQKSTGSAKDRDVTLAKVETEKRLALIKAWEDNEKTKAENKAFKKVSAVGAWENTKKANVEAELKQIEEELERKKAEYAEKMKNKMAEIHREAEEKKAMIEAKRGEDFLKVEETAAKFRETGNMPKRLLGCFGF